MVETVPFLEKMEASAQLQAANEEFEGFYQVIESFENDVTHIINDDVQKRRAIVVAGRAAAVAPALQQKQNARAVDQNVLIQNLREGSGF